MNRIEMGTYRYSDIRSVDSDEAFHELLVRQALERYQQIVGAGGLGSALAVCANFREARYFPSFPFTEIMVTGVGDWREEVREASREDPRVSYREENCEALSFPSRSFDFVFCKEGLHHLARPALGLYEMLRVCRKAAIIIEPFESLLERALQGAGVATRFEKAGRGRRRGPAAATRQINPLDRDNYVFHWSKRGLQTLLNSYYVDSGYRVEMRVGWLSKRINARSPRAAREAAALLGTAASHVPGMRGNLMTALVLPGSDLPLDPGPFPPDPHPSARAG